MHGAALSLVRLALCLLVLGVAIGLLFEASRESKRANAASTALAAAPTSDEQAAPTSDEKAAGAATQVDFLYTVNNLGYTATCG